MKIIELAMREEQDPVNGEIEYSLYRKSDGKRECLPFESATDALMWSINTRLNGTVYHVVTCGYMDMTI